MSSSSKITISYQLSPPAEIDGGELKTSNVHSFDVKAPAGEDQTAYYAALRTAIAEAKNTIGDELTAWRDKVGKAELSKEPKARDEADEEDEEENDEEA